MYDEPANVGRCFSIECDRTDQRVKESPGGYRVFCGCGLKGRERSTPEAAIAVFRLKIPHDSPRSN